MKKFPIVPVIVAIAAFALSVLAASRVEDGRAALTNNSQRLSRVYLPHLGMDKFVADLKWVKIVQEMGWHSEEGEMTREAAIYFANVADSITDLDPDMATAYELVGLRVAIQAPQHAIDLFGKARKYGLKEDWRWPFYAGHITERYLSRTDIPEADWRARATAFYGEASDVGGRPAYVDRVWMRCATGSAGENSVKQLLAQKTFVMNLKPAMMAGLGGSMGVVGANSMGLTDTSYSRLKKVLLREARVTVGELLVQIAEERNPAKKDALRRDLDEVRGVFDVFKPKGHVCSNCLDEYGPGEFFCSNCSKKVDPYGYCLGCWTRGSLILLQGEYCHICGAKAL